MSQCAKTQDGGRRPLSCVQVSNKFHSVPAGWSRTSREALMVSLLHRGGAPYQPAGGAARQVSPVESREEAGGASSLSGSSPTVAPPPQPSLRTSLMAVDLQVAYSGWRDFQASFHHRGRKVVSSEDQLVEICLDLLPLTNYSVSVTELSSHFTVSVRTCTPLTGGHTHSHTQSRPHTPPTHKTNVFPQLRPLLTCPTQRWTPPCPL